MRMKSLAHRYPVLFLTMVFFVPPTDSFSPTAVPARTRVRQLPRHSLWHPLASAVVDDIKEVKSRDKMTPEAKELLDAFDAKKGGRYGLMVAQTAPSVRVAFPEEFGMQPGSLSTGHLVAALKELGFDLVLDTNTAADLTIMEEGTELLNRISARQTLLEKNKDADLGTFGEKPVPEPLPLFTSCCPGWLALIEKSEPDLAPYISTCKSPHMMYGAMVKEYSQEMLGKAADQIYMTSVMPCVRKRGESDRPAFVREDGVRDVDNVITTQDLGQLCRLKGIDPTKLEPMPFDSPFQTNDGEGTGAGQLFGATGGVMEAAVRTVYEVVTGAPLPRLELDAVRGLDGVKEATLSLFNDETGKGIPIEIKVAVINGLGNAKKLIKQLKDGEVQYDFIEVMACPGGCIAGGGQPKGDKEALGKRLALIYELDRTLSRRKSHENPVVKAFYDKFLGEYGGHKAHHLLHVKPVYGGTDE